MKYHLIGLICAVLLSGCGGITPAGMLAAMRLDPLETDPSDIAVAVSSPDAFSLRDGDATLRITFEPDIANPAHAVAMQVPLSIAEATSSSGAPMPKPGETIHVLNFTETAAEKLRAVQKQILEQRSNGIEGAGTISVSVNGGCLKSTFDGELPITTWLRTGPTETFVKLSAQPDLLSELAKSDLDELQKGLPQCEPTQ